MVVSRDDKQVSLHVYQSERAIGLPRSTKASSRDPRRENRRERVGFCLIRQPSAVPIVCFHPKPIGKKEKVQSRSAKGPISEVSN